MILVTAETNREVHKQSEKTRTVGSIGAGHWKWFWLQQSYALVFFILNSFFHSTVGLSTTKKVCGAQLRRYLFLFYLFLYLPQNNGPHHKGNQITQKHKIV